MAATQARPCGLPSPVMLCCDLVRLQVDDFDRMIACGRDKQAVAREVDGEMVELPGDAGKRNGSAEWQRSRRLRRLDRKRTCKKTEPSKKCSHCQCPNRKQEMCGRPGVYP